MYFPRSSFMQASAATVESDALLLGAAVPRPGLIAGEIVIASQTDADPRGESRPLLTGTRDRPPHRDRCDP